MQIELFDPSVENNTLRPHLELINENIDSGDPDLIALAVLTITTLGHAKILALWYIIERIGVFDWGKLWEQFENEGKMVLFDFYVGNQSFRLVNEDDQLHLNGRLLYALTQKDKYTVATTEKIKQALKKYLSDNIYQFNI